MKRTLWVALFGLLLVAAPSEVWARGGHRGHHRHHFHGHHHFHSSFWVGHPFWWGPPVWWGPHYVYHHRTVVVEEPPVYIERGVSPATAGWWYYCESEDAYYPDVYSCSEPWVKVAPQPD